MEKQNYSPEQLRELLSCTLEEPEAVTMKMREAYKIIRMNDAEQNKKRKRTYKKAAGTVAAAAAAALIVTTPVMAGGIGKAWDAVTAAIFGVDEKVQKTYEDTGLSQTFDASQQTKNAKPDAPALPAATVDGMTLSLKQVLTDGFMLYLNVDVEAPEDMEIDGECLFQSTKLLVDGRPLMSTGSMAMSGGFVEDAYAAAKNHRAYEIVYNTDDGIDLDGKHLTLQFTDFQMDKGNLDMETAIKGSWALNWDMSAAYHGKTVSISLTGGTCGEYAKLKSIDITPLSYTLHYDYAGNSMQLFDDSLWVEFVMKDGTIVNEYNNQNSVITGNGGLCNMSFSRECFKKLLDVDEIAGVRIDGVTYPIK